MELINLIHDISISTIFYYIHDTYDLSILVQKDYLPSCCILLLVISVVSFDVECDY